MPKVDLTIRSNINKGYIPQTLRDQACRIRCEACDEPYGTFVRTPRGRVVKARQIIDHLFPRRWLLNFNATPNVSVNLLSVCQVCHPRKLRAENYLFEGNALSYVQELRRLNWPKK